MTGFLSYWKDVWDKHEDPTKTPIDWATDSKDFYDMAQIGDTIWGVIPGPPNAPKEWRLLEAVVIKEKRSHRGITAYGRYYFKGDAKRSRMFNLKLQPDFTAVLWLLEFRTRTPIRLAGAIIGQALQSHGARRLSHRDVALLESYADALSEVAAQAAHK